MLLNLVNQSTKLLKNIEEKGFFHLLSANVFIGFLGFGSQLLVARFLSPVVLGQIKIMRSYVSVGTLLSEFGFNTAVLKLCSEKRHMEERLFIFKQNLIFTSIPIMFVLIAMLILRYQGLLSPDVTVNRWLPLYILVIPSTVYTSLIMVYLRALKMIHLIAKMQIIIRLFGISGLVCITYFYGLPGFILSSIFIGYIGLLPLLYLVKDVFKSKTTSHNVFSQSFFYAKWSFCANLFATIGQHLDIFMINFLITDREQFGYYSLSTIFVIGLNYIPQTVRTIAVPYFSEKSNDKKEFLRALIKYEKLMVLGTFGLSLLSFIIVPVFIQKFYGTNYAPTTTYFKILVLKFFFWSCSALFGSSIVGLGRMRNNFLTGLIGFPISLCLTYFFITTYGVIGVAVAQVIGYFIKLIIAVLMFMHVIKISFRNL